MATPFRKARRKNLLPLQYEQKSFGTQTEDMDLTRFLFGKNFSKFNLKGSNEKKLAQAMQIIESFKVKMTIGIEKYSELKSELANATKEKKTAEKELAKAVEKYDHKIAKLSDKNYKLKDELEDKEGEAEKLQAKLEKIRELYGVESEDDEEDEDDDDSEDTDAEDLVIDHSELCEFYSIPVGQSENGVVKNDDDFDELLTVEDVIKEAAKSESESEEDSAESASDGEDLEEVIHDMTEQFYSRIEELEKKLEKKEEQVVLKNAVEHSENEQTDDDSLSSTTDCDLSVVDVDSKLNVISSEGSECDVFMESPTEQDRPDDLQIERDPVPEAVGVFAPKAIETNERDAGYSAEVFSETKENVDAAQPVKPVSVEEDKITCIY